MVLLPRCARVTQFGNRITAVAVRDDVRQLRNQVLLAHP
jgi:hypothetical protein